MNIHEIIHAWENSVLPEDLAALAAVESKLDEYAEVASEWEEKAKIVNVKAHYMNQYGLYYLIMDEVQAKIEAAIPDVVISFVLSDEIPENWQKL